MPQTQMQPPLPELQQELQSQQLQLQQLQLQIQQLQQQPSEKLPIKPKKKSPSQPSSKSQTPKLHPEKSQIPSICNESHIPKLHSEKLQTRFHKIYIEPKDVNPEVESHSHINRTEIQTKNLQPENKIVRLPSDFNWMAYRSLNHDLTHIHDHKTAAQHYMDHGNYQNRPYKFSATNELNRSDSFKPTMFQFV